MIKKKKSVNIAYIIVILIIVFFLFNLFINKSATESFTPSSRAETYFVRSGLEGPNITEVIIDPFMPDIGEVQYFIVKANFENSINQVSISLKTDNGVNNLDLKLSEGSDMEGTWMGSWEVKDTNINIYEADVKVASQAEVSSVYLTMK